MDYRIGDPTLQWVEIFRRAVVLRLSQLRPGRLHRAEQRIQAVAAGLGDKHVRHCVGQLELQAIGFGQPVGQQAIHQIVPRFGLLQGLLVFTVILVTALPERAARENARVGLYRGPLRITRRQSGNTDAGAQQPGRALEEHQADRWVIQFLRTDRFGQTIDAASVLLVPGGTLGLIVVHLRPEFPRESPET